MGGAQSEKAMPINASKRDASCSEESGNAESDIAKTAEIECTVDRKVRGARSSGAGLLVGGTRAFVRRVGHDQASQRDVVDDLLDRLDVVLCAKVRTGRYEVGNEP